MSQAGSANTEIRSRVAIDGVEAAVQQLRNADIAWKGLAATAAATVNFKFDAQSLTQLGTQFVEVRAGITNTLNATAQLKLAQSEAALATAFYRNAQAGATAELAAQRVAATESAAALQAEKLATQQAATEKAKLATEAQAARTALSEMKLAAAEDATAVRAAGTAAAESESAFAKFGSTVKMAVANVAAQGFAELAGKAKEAAAGALDVGMAVQSALAKFQAVGGGADALNKMGITMDGIHDKALQVTRDFGTMPQASAEGLYQLETAGFSATAAMQAIGGAAALARDQQIGLGNAAKFTAGVENAFNIQASQTTQVVGVMSAVANASAIEVGDLAESLSYAGPVAGALGYSFKDVSVAIGLMGNNMIVGSMAGTSLRTMMTSLANDSSKGSTALHELGIATQTAGGQMVPLGTIMGQLRTASQNLTDAEKEQLAQAISGKTGMAGLLAIMNSTDAQYQAMTNSVNDGAGAMKRYQDAIEATFGYQVNQAKANIAGLEDSLFRGLSPALMEVSKEFNATFGTQGAQAEAQKMGAAVGKVIGDISSTAHELASTWLPPLKTAFSGLFTEAAKLAPDFEATLKSVASNGLKLLTDGVHLAKDALVGFSPEIQIGLAALRLFSDIVGNNGIPAIAGLTTAIVAFKAVAFTQSIPDMIAGWGAKLGIMATASEGATVATEGLTAATGMLDIALGPVGIAIGAIAIGVALFTANANAGQQILDNYSKSITANAEAVAKAKGEYDTLGHLIVTARDQQLGELQALEDLGKKFAMNSDAITSAVEVNSLRQTNAAFKAATAGMNTYQALGVAARDYASDATDTADAVENEVDKAIAAYVRMQHGNATATDAATVAATQQKYNIEIVADATDKGAHAIENSQTTIQRSLDATAERYKALGTVAAGVTFNDFFSKQTNTPSRQGPALVIQPKVSIVPDDPAVIEETKKEADRLAKELADIMGGKKTVFADAFAGAWDQVPSAMAASLQRNLPAIQGEVARLAQSLQDAAPQIRTEMKGVFDAITSSASDSKGAGDLPNVIRQQWEAAQGIIKNLSPALQAQVRQTFTDMANVALQQNSTIDAAAGQAFVGVSGVIGERLDTTRAVVVDRWGRVVDAMTGKTQEIETVAQKAAGDAYTRTIQDIGNLQKAFDGSKTGLGDAFKTQLTAVDTALASGSADWQKTADDGWKAVSAIIGKDPKLEASARFQWDKYVGEIKSHEDAISKAAQDNGAAVGAGLTAGFNTTTGKFDAAIDASMVQAQAQLKKHLDPEEAKSIGTLYVGGVAAGVDTGKSGVTTATDAVSKSMADTQTSVDTTMTAITNSVTTGMAGAQTAVQTGMANLAAAVLAGGSVMIHDADITAANVAIAFGSGDWYSVGAQIDAGVASGITANSGAISGAATRAMDGAMAAAQAHMQISSPSKKSHTLLGVPTGQGVVTGVVAGIQQATPDALKAITDMANALKSSVEAMNLALAFKGIADGQIGKVTSGMVSVGRAMAGAFTQIGAKDLNSGALFGEALNKEVGPVKTAVEALNAASTFGGITEGKIAGLMNPIILLSQKMRDGAKIVGDMTGAAGWGENLAKMVAPLKAAAEGLAAAAGFTGVSADQLATLLNPLILLAEKERDSLKIVGDAGAADAATYGDALTKIVAPIKTAEEALAGLGDVPAVSESQIANVTNPIILLAEKERDSAKIVGDLAQGGDYATNVGKIVDGFMKVIDFSTKLATAGSVQFPFDVVQQLVSDAERFTQAEAQAAARIGPEGIKAAAALGDAISKVMDGLDKALSFEEHLGTAAGTPGTPATYANRQSTKFHKGHLGRVQTSPGTPGQSFEDVLAQAAARMPLLVQAVSDTVTAVNAASQAMLIKLGGGNAAQGEKVLQQATAFADDSSKMIGAVDAIVVDFTTFAGKDSIRGVDAGIANTLSVIDKLVAAAPAMAQKLSAGSSASATFNTAASQFVANMSGGLASVHHAVNAFGGLNAVVPAVRGGTNTPQNTPPPTPISVGQGPRVVLNVMPFPGNNQYLVVNKDELQAMITKMAPASTSSAIGSRTQNVQAFMGTGQFAGAA